MIMSYEEYLERTKEKDSRSAWVAWKIEVCGMEPNKAIRASCDKEWGWKPITSTTK